MSYADDKQFNTYKTITYNSWMIIMRSGVQKLHRDENRKTHLMQLHQPEKFIHTSLPDNHFVNQMFGPAEFIHDK